MKKSAVLFLIIIIILTFNSCSRKTNYKFLNKTSMISSTEIIILGEYNTIENAFNETLVAVISDHESFLSDFNSMNCYNHWTDPLGVFENDTVIKITYNNGEYEMIGCYGQGKYCHYINYPSNFHSYSGYYTFDDEQFNLLIDKYS